METTQKELLLNEMHLKKGAQVIRAVNHNLRQQMLSLIHTNGRITVTNIFIKFRIEQPVASQHLAILRSAGLLLTERQGKFIFYSINYEKLKEVQRIAAQLANS
jgi:DNA-binding transcriptional ArsR family regulator